MIKKNKIRSLNPYKRLIPQSKNVYVGLVSPDKSQLKKIGFSEELKNGETILPRPVGKASVFNANGRTIKHVDQPMETAYTTIEWQWTELHGRTRVAKSDFRDRPYKRYPRSHVPAPSIQLTLHTDTEGNQVVLTSLIEDWSLNQQNLIHAVNLLLDIFGKATFFDEKLKQVLTAPVHYLNWRVLPEGKHPYSVLRQEVRESINRVKKGNKSFVTHRLERINSYDPAFTAIGQGGFTGYVIFGFPSRGIFILESILYGNATYVLGEDWEKISRMTKAEILDSKLHKDRIVHLRKWFAKIRSLLAD